MREQIDKKLKNAKIFRIYLLMLLIVALGSSFLFGAVEESNMIYPCVMLLAFALMISGSVYMASFKPYTRSVKWLESKGLANIADDIDLKRPTLPRSKIYCGQNAFFGKKPIVIIPYSEVAWVYVFVSKAYGFTVGKSVILYTKDGKKFTLQANDDEIKWLLENYVIKHSPNLIIGFGPHQKARYKELKNSTKQ